MRNVLCCILLAIVAAVTAFAAGPKPSSLTIVLDFRGQSSARSIAVMKREAEGILKATGVHLNWRLRSEAPLASSSDLVVVQFNGACILEPQPYIYDELGPLAFTYSTDGAVQPFSEVSCDRISALLRSGLHGDDFSHADLFLGRALGRVVAHELVHMLTGARKHSDTGVFQPGLTMDQLTAGELPLDLNDLDRSRPEP